MKNNRGITLISLVMTIMLILILSTVGTYSGLQSYNNMRVQAYVAKMKIIQDAVDKLCDEKTIEEINELGGSSSSAAQSSVLEEVISQRDELKYWYDEAGDSIAANYRYFSIQDIERYLGVRDFDTGIFFNPRTRNVISVRGIKYNDRTYYRQCDLSGGRALQMPNTDTNFYLDVCVKTFDNKAVIYVDTEDYNVASLKYAKDGGDYRYCTDLKRVDTKIGEDIKSVYQIPITESGIYSIEANLNTNGDITKTASDIEVTIVNRPMLVEGMTPIVFNDYNDYVEVISADEEDYYNEMAKYEDWYNYSATEKKWANVKLNDGSIYVWVPRYAYKFNEANENISIKFLKGSSAVVSTDGSSIPTGYKTHPAFCKGVSTGFANGEWDEEITGIWVAKYEAYTDGDYAQSRFDTTATVGKTPANYALYCKNIKTSVSGLDVDNVDTHLMKNSEWGATAYLTWSDYGINRELTAKAGFSNSLTSITYFSTGENDNYSGIMGLVGGVEEVVAAGLNISELDATYTASNKYATLYPEDLSTTFGDGVGEIENWSMGNLEKSYPATDELFVRGGYNNGSSGSRYHLFSYCGVENDISSTVGYRPVLIVEY